MKLDSSIDRARTTPGEIRSPEPTLLPEPAARDERAQAVPCLRLFVTEVVVDRGDLFRSEFDAFEAPLLALSFDYGGRRVRASDPAQRVLWAGAGGIVEIPRDVAAERRARRVLESFGAVDLDSAWQYAVAPDTDADYLVRCEGDVHDYCSFGAIVIPQLRALGWRIEIDPAYPYRIVTDDLPWYAHVAPDERRPDWFSLELGIELDGRRVNLLPALLDLLETTSASGGLRALTRRSKHVALQVGESLWLPIPADRVRGILRIVTELYQGGSGKRAMFDERRAHALLALDEVFAGSGTRFGWHGDRRGLAIVDRKRAAPAPHAEAPAELCATLRPYQKDGLGWLQTLRETGAGGILADDMGLGKTLQTIAHLVVEKRGGRLDRPALVVAPTSLVGNWEREVRKFAPHLSVVAYHGPRRHERSADLARADVVVTSYPLLVRDEEKLARHDWSTLILDEAQTIKNIRGQAHRAVRAIRSEHRLCLTGTPVENHLGELWALVDFLTPGLLGDELHFGRFYRLPIEKLGDEDRLDALRHLLAPYILRRRKDEVARDLPPKTELMRPVELAGKQRELYESLRVAAHGQVRKLIKNKGLAASTPSILGALMKLRQLCCDPRLLAMDAARFVRESAKHDLLFELLERQLGEGHRVLLFSQFTSMLGLIAKGLRERGVKYVALTGATADRQRVIDTFESGRADVFLISLKAGGTGLTLTSADTVIHYDPWWNPASQAQATDRAYRIGQTKPVFVYNLFVAGSVEERILALQRRKRHLADAILGAAQKTADLTEELVDELFAPLND